MYTKLYFDYTLGINKMWTPEEIELQKQSPSFEREYNLKFLGGIGNIFRQWDIDKALQDKYSLDPRDTLAIVISS